MCKWSSWSRWKHKYENRMRYGFESQIWLLQGRGIIRNFVRQGRVKILSLNRKWMCVFWWSWFWFFRKLDVAADFWNYIVLISVLLKMALLVLWIWHFCRHWKSRLACIGRLHVCECVFVVDFEDGVFEMPRLRRGEWLGLLRLK